MVQATEDFMVHLLEDCNLCAIHAKRITISASVHLNVARATLMYPTSRLKSLYYLDTHLKR